MWVLTCGFRFDVERGLWSGCVEGCLICVFGLDFGFRCRLCSVGWMGVALCDCLAW